MSHNARINGSKVKRKSDSVDREGNGSLSNGMWYHILFSTPKVPAWHLRVFSHASVPNQSLPLVYYHPIRGLYKQGHIGVRTWNEVSSDICRNSLWITMHLWVGSFPVFRAFSIHIVNYALNNVSRFHNEAVLYQYYIAVHGLCVCFANFHHLSHNYVTLRVKKTKYVALSLPCLWCSIERWIDSGQVFTASGDYSLN